MKMAVVKQNEAASKENKAQNSTLDYICNNIVIICNDTQHDDIFLQKFVVVQIKSRKRKSNTITARVSVVTKFNGSFQHFGEIHRNVIVPSCLLSIPFSSLFFSLSLSSVISSHFCPFLCRVFFFLLATLILTKSHLNVNNRQI